jgi:hypothetical protein
MAEQTATQLRTTQNKVAGIGEAYTVKNLCSTLELTAASAADTIDFGRIPSNARILPTSRLYLDDCATTGAPTLDLGLFNVDSNITDDDDAIGNGFDLATAANDLVIFSDIANIALPAWDLVNGQTTDPGGSFIVKGTVKDAGTNQTGTVVLDLHYVID